jgi:hypothetical protein
VLLVMAALRIWGGILKMCGPFKAFILVTHWRVETSCKLYGWSDNSCRRSEKIAGRTKSSGQELRDVCEAALCGHD